MFKSLGTITSYSFSFSSASGILSGSDGYSYDCNQKLSSILSDPTYKANDLVYSMTEDWFHKHAEQCRIPSENTWNWDCIRMVVAPNVLSDAYLPLYPAIDAWIQSKRPSGSGSSGSSGSGSGSGSGSDSGSGSGSSGSNVDSGFFSNLGTMGIVAAVAFVAFILVKR